VTRPAIRARVLAGGVIFPPVLAGASPASMSGEAVRMDLYSRFPAASRPVSARRKSPPLRERGGMVAAKAGLGREPELPAVIVFPNKP